jgi:hypothetical protein
MEMVMRAPTVLLVAVVAGCTGQIDADVPEGISPEQEAARQAWITKAQPVLAANCASCHDGTMAGIAWFEGAPDPYAQKTDLLTYEKMIVSLDAPMTSLLVKKGAHDGPALTAPQSSSIVEWITKERDAQPNGGMFPVMLPAQAMMLCMAGAPGSPTCPYNTVPLDGVGAAGAKVEFTATQVGADLYVSNLKVVPGPMGVYMEHPLFVSVPATGEPKLDPLDRFASVTKNLAAAAPAAMQTIGTGSTSFLGFSAADPLAIYAKSVGPMK